MFHFPKGLHVTTWSLILYPVHKNNPSLFSVRALRHNSKLPCWPAKKYSCTLHKPIQNQTKLPHLQFPDIVGALDINWIESKRSDNSLDASLLLLEHTILKREIKYSVRNVISQYVTGAFCNILIKGVYLLLAH